MAADIPLCIGLPCGHAPFRALPKRMAACLDVLSLQMC